MPRGSAVLVLSAALLVQAGASAANPWLKEEGDAELIANLEISQQPTGLNNQTARASSYLHLEYGYDARATLIADIDAQQYSWDGTGKTRFNNGRLGVRTAFARWSNSLLSGEWVAGVLAVRDNALPDAAVSLNGTAEGRLMFGQGFDVLDRHGFTGIEAGWRWRPGPPADEAVLDAILGIAPWPSALLMLQSFSILGTGKATGAYSRYSVSKLELSVAQGVTGNLSVQAGILYQVAGREAGSAGIALALWWRVSSPLLSPVIF